jgi:hypothetical protein
MACIAAKRTLTYSRHISRDHYSTSLLAHQSDLQKHSFLYCCVLDCVYRAVVWQRVDQIRYSIKLLGLVRSNTFTFSSLESMHRLCITLVISKLAYASVVWNSITSTDANKLERIQQRFAALYFNCFFPQANYCYSQALEELILHTLRMRRHRLDALSLIQVYIGCTSRLSVLTVVRLRVSPRYIRDFALFIVCSSCKNCPSARCTSAANVVCKDVDVFGAKNVLLNHIL